VAIEDERRAGDLLRRTPWVCALRNSLKKLAAELPVPATASRIADRPTDPQS
jgi:hypothetical protein